MQHEKQKDKDARGSNHVLKLRSLSKVTSYGRRKIKLVGRVDQGKTAFSNEGMPFNKFE